MVLEDIVSNIHSESCIFERDEHVFCHFLQDNGYNGFLISNPKISSWGDM